MTLEEAMKYRGETVRSLAKATETAPSCVKRWVQPGGLERLSAVRLQQIAQQMQKMAAIIDQQNGTNVSAAAGAAAQAAGSTGGGGGGGTSVKSTTNSLGDVVGQSGSNSMATQAAQRAMDVNNPNKE